jgi:hypothetical protein
MSRVIGRVMGNDFADLAPGQCGENVGMCAVDAHRGASYECPDTIARPVAPSAEIQVRIDDDVVERVGIFRGLDLIDKRPADDGLSQVSAHLIARGVHARRVQAPVPKVRYSTLPRSYQKNRYIKRIQVLTGECYLFSKVVNGFPEMREFSYVTRG